MNKDNNKARIIAAVSTLLVAALIVLLLVYTHLEAVDLNLAKVEEPQEEEEIFIDAELEEESLPEPEPIPTPLEEGTNTEPTDEPQPQEAAAVAPKGEPDKAPVENNQIKVADPKLPKKPVSEPKQVTTTKPSETKVSQTSNNDKENKAISSKVGNAFGNNTPNGKTTGKDGGTGSAASGKTTGSSTGTASVSGGPSGRKLLNSPAMKPKLDKEVTIKVKVMVNAAGKVTEASFVSDSGPGKGNTALRNQCVAAARNLKWNAVDGAPDASGIMTFKLTPQ